MTLWPDLLEERPADPIEYSHVMASHFKAMSRLMAGTQLHVSPMTCDGLVEHAAGSDYDAGSGEARAGYAAELLSRGVGVPWPPRRNDECWCRSGMKYKECCGPVLPAEYPDRA